MTRIPELIMRLGGALGGRIKSDGTNEFRFTVASDMQLFCDCIEDMGWFPCEDWLLMSVLVVKEKMDTTKLSEDEKKADTKILDVRDVWKDE